MTLERSSCTREPNVATPSYRPGRQEWPVYATLCLLRGEAASDISEAERSASDMSNPASH